MSTVVSQFKLI